LIRSVALPLLPLLILLSSHRLSSLSLSSTCLYQSETKQNNFHPRLEQQNVISSFHSTHDLFQKREFFFYAQIYLYCIDLVVGSGHLLTGLEAGCVWSSRTGGWIHWATRVGQSRWDPSRLNCPLRHQPVFPAPSNPTKNDIPIPLTSSPNTSIPSKKQNKKVYSSIACPSPALSSLDRITLTSTCRSKAHWSPLQTFCFLLSSHCFNGVWPLYMSVKQTTSFFLFFETTLFISMLSFLLILLPLVV
jgi:hypothetical protein